jgi:hypothetical protein
MMNLESLKRDSKYLWTQHVIRKMAFYGLSPDKVRRIIRNPKRVEDGIAENTIGVMQPGTNSKKPTEVWAMYQKKGSKKIIISAWRYPGISPIGKQIPIPQDIIEELKKDGLIDN